MGRKTVITVVAVILALFQLWTAATIPYPEYIQRSIHLGFVLILAFLAFPFKKNDKFLALDVVLALAAVALCAYIAINRSTIIRQSGRPFGIEPWLGLIMVLLVMESARRTVGWPLPILAVLAILYALFGHNLGDWGFPQLALRDIFAYQYTTTSAIWGMPVAMSATMIATFVMLGAFFSVTGLDKVFSSLAFAVAGRLAGGPALVAVVSSGFIGMINGSGVANVLTCGTYTIPLMKRAGYSPAFAGGVEAAASTGGQIMPPVMGAAAFLMAEFLDISYWKIVIAAVIPGILYYVAMAFAVQAETSRAGLGKTQPDESAPTLGHIFIHDGYLLLPVILLTVMIAMGWGPSKAAFYAIICVVLMGLLRKETRIGLKKLLMALETGAKSLLSIAPAGACAGIVLGVVAETGLGAKFSILMVSMSGGIQLVALLLAAIAALILGMSLPVVACYAVAASALATGLVMVGIQPLVAHFFIMYFAVFSGLTPPVCVTAYAAAGLAQAPWLNVAWNSCKLGIPMFILGFMFVYNPGLLAIGPLWKIVLEGTVAMVGLVMVARGFFGYIFHKASALERTLFILGGIVLTAPTNWLTMLVGGGLAGIVVVSQLRTGRRLAKASAGSLNIPGA